MSQASHDALIYGMPKKYVSLATLVVQNSTLVLAMRYSRVLPGPRYLSSTAVVLAELLKLTISMTVHLREQRKTGSEYAQLPVLSIQPSAPAAYTLRQLGLDVFGPKSGFFKLLIPAVLYTLQNNLQFVAASNLDAATFQVTYQCKILTTAVLAVLILGQRLNARKWIALLILTLGVACVQIPSTSTTPSTPPSSATPASEGNYVVGLIAVALACVLSGFAGVYFEKILKVTSPSTSVWLRNIQLSIACLVIAISGTLAWDGRAIMTAGFFQGYNPVVLFTITVQAAGGLIVALVVKYADNILKGFATSLSIILSTVASVFIFDFVVTKFFLIGAALVFLATYLYSMPEPKSTEVKIKSVNGAEGYQDRNAEHEILLEDGKGQFSETSGSPRSTGSPPRQNGYRDDYGLKEKDQALRIVVHEISDSDDSASPTDARR